MTLNKWKLGPFTLPGVRPMPYEAPSDGSPDGGCPTHHKCIETLSQASPDEVQKLTDALTNADVALFTALGHYWNGMARVLHAEIENDERIGFKEAATSMQQALEQLKVVRKHEEQIISIAQNIEYSAYFVRRHEVVSQQTKQFLQALEAMKRDLADGYYPAASATALNKVLTQMMASFDLNAQVEGVLTRFEFGQLRNRA